ncbi:XcbB/CpsF family capsular polysaccharide biosynthesis protein [Vagococcus salmoninarum]|uniref:XcbB/CpsF family capsular polysaccharide biosynthesis protein n=1 Tax=Vagococcus salmoninarum TaxID=2739 RepID=UPI003F99E62C
MEPIKIDLETPFEEWTSDKVIVDTNSHRNLLQLSVIDDKCLRLYENLVEQDYVLYMHADNSSYFSLRSKVNTLWKRQDLERLNGLFYTLTTPKEKNSMGINKLLVCFSSPGAGDKKDSARMPDRYFSNVLDKLDVQFVNNTYVLRMMDLNLTWGSQYLNTKNYLTYEDDVARVITNIQEKFSISNEDVILYGEVEGGAAALYHSCNGIYNAVAIAPTWRYEDQGNRNYYSNLLVSEQKIERSEEDNSKKIIITSSIVDNKNVKDDWKERSVEMLDVFNSKIGDVKDIRLETTPEILTVINNIFMDSQTLKEKYSVYKKFINQ